MSQHSFHPEKPNSHRLSFSRLTVFLIFLTLLSAFLAAAGFFSTNLLRGELQYRTHELNTQLLSEQIGNLIRDRFKVLDALSKNQFIIDLLENRIPPANVQLQTTLNTANEVSHSNIIYVLNSEGTAIASALIDAPLPTGYNYDFRPFFRKAMEGQRDIYPALGVVSGKRGIHLSIPVYGQAKDSPVGVVILKILASEIEDLLKVKKQKVAMISPEGIVFATNQPAWLFKSTRKLSADEWMRIQVTRQFGALEAVPIGLDLNRGTVATDRHNYYAAHASLGMGGWEVVSLERKNNRFELPLLYKLMTGGALGVSGSLAIMMFWLMANISRRRATESRLRRAEQKYRGIFENAVMGIYQTTIDGRFITASPSLAAMLGFGSAEELISKVSDIGAQTYLEIGDRAKLLGLIEQHGEIKGFETQFMRKDGRPIWVSLTARMVRDDSSATIIEGFCLDITGKKTTEEALHRERDIFARVMETSPVGIMLTAADGLVKFANQKAVEILRLEKDGRGCYQAPPYSICDFDGNPLEREHLLEAQVQASGKTVHGVRHCIVRPDEAPVYLSINMAPVIDDQGRVVEFVSVFEDISARVKAEKEAVVRKENLILADRMISMGILASGVAHEINNPNTFIMMNAQLLADAWGKASSILDLYLEEHGDFQIGNMNYSKLRDKLPIACTRVVEGSRRIKRIVEELRNYSRKESMPRKESVNLNRVIQSAEILLGNMIKTSTARFSLRIDEGIPPIRGDTQRLEQVIINVLQNACQALPDQSRGIRVSTAYDAAASMVVVACQDEGEGIEEHVLKHVCDPFFSTKREKGGTGLGLSISSTIVQEHEGTMEIMSQKGHGTTVVLKFPVEKSNCFC